jgi:hypothetical protein
MRNQNASNFAVCLVTALLTTFLVALGWFTVWQGGITLKGKSGHLSYVGGGYATAFALGVFLIAAFSGLVLARAFGLGRLGTALVLATIIAPPVIYLIW